MHFSFVRVRSPNIEMYRAAFSELTSVPVAQSGEGLAASYRRKLLLEGTMKYLVNLEASCIKAPFNLTLFRYIYR